MEYTKGNPSYFVMIYVNNDFVFLCTIENRVIKFLSWVFHLILGTWMIKKHFIFPFLW